MILADIERLLTREIGLDPATIGSAATERAVQERLGACRINDARAYWNRVRTSTTELQALIEAVVVPESWFFRDPAAFAALAQIATDRAQALPAGQQLRLLSIPCSTGEEPYSMAVTLIEAGLPPLSFRIDAVDVSGRALEKARHGVYGRNSFRSRQSAAESRYFEPVAAGLRVAPRLRDLVTFRQGNLLHPSSLQASATYDVIFCRNVLIYFDAAAQDLAVSQLSRALKTDGVLFVGTAEGAVVRARHAQPTAFGNAFSMRRPAVSLDPARASPGDPPRTGRSLRPSTPIAVPAAHRPQSAATMSAPGAAPMANSGGLAESARLANAGRFAEAAALCDRQLLEHGPSAQAYCLLGVFRDATDDRAGAADAYRKVLYLEPEHEEALIHLAVSLEAGGQIDEAKRLRARAQRVAQRRERRP